MENLEKEFLEFKITYDVEKIKENYVEIEYCNMMSNIPLNRRELFYIIDKVFSQNTMKMEIVKNENSKFALKEEKTIIKILYEYIILSIVANSTNEGVRNILNDLRALKYITQPKKTVDYHIASLLRHIKENLFTANNMYSVKEKQEHQIAKPPANLSEKEQIKTVLYGLNIINISESKNQEDGMNFFVKAAQYWIDHMVYTLQAIFQIENNNFDKKELYDLKFLYEETTNSGTRLVDYGVKYINKNKTIKDKLLKYNNKNYKTLDDLVNLFREDGLVADKKELKIVMSVENNKSNIIQDSRIIIHYTHLLLVIELLCKKFMTIDELFDLNYVFTIEGLCDLMGYAKISLKEVEYTLIKHIKECPLINIGISEDEIKEKVTEHKEMLKAIRNIIKYLGTWKVEEDINKLPKFRMKYIIAKLTEQQNIRCSHEYITQISQQESYQRIEDNTIFSNIMLVSAGLFGLVSFVIVIKIILMCKRILEL